MDSDAKPSGVRSVEETCGDSRGEPHGGSGAIAPSGGDTQPSELIPDTGYTTRLKRRLKRAQKLEDIKWAALEADRYVPRALALLRAIAFGEDDERNPVGVDKLQYEALKDYLDMALGDLPSFTEKVLKDDFVASVFESAATAIRTAFGDLEDFDARMRECALAFYNIIQASGVMDT